MWVVTVKVSDPASVPEVMVWLFVTEAAEPLYVTVLLTALIVIGRAVTVRAKFCVAVPVTFVAVTV